METCCKDCVFAQKTTTVVPEDKEFDIPLKMVRTQTNCHLNRIEKFKEVSSEEVQEAYNDEGTVEYKGETIPLQEEFFLIKRNCTTFRKAKDYPELDNLEEQGPTREQLLDGLAEQVRSQISLRFALVIPVTEGFKKGAMTRLVNSIKKLSYSPHFVYFVGDDKILRPLAQALAKIIGEEPKFTWRLIGVLDGLEDYKELTGSVDGKLIDTAIEKLPKGHISHYAVFYPGRAIPESFFADVNNAINEDLLKITLLTPNKYNNGLLVQTSLHKDPRVFGNGVMEIGGKLLWKLEDKVKKLLEDQQMDSGPYIKKVGEVCKKLK